MRLRPSAALTVLAVLLLPAVGRAAAPTFAAYSDTVRNEESFSWNVPLVLRNPLDVGLYVDSLALEIRDLDPGETRVPRTSVVPLDMMVRVMQGTSPGDSSMFDYSGPATAEYADLTFRLQAHDAHGRTYRVSTLVHARGGVLTTAFPSRVVQLGGRRVELVELAPTGVVDPVPGIVVVHGHGANARKLLPQALSLVRRGYGVVVVSLPGYGASDGPADAGGSATLATLAAALSAVKAMPGVDSARVALWGLGRGATAVALFAAGRSDIRGAILQQATYDLWAEYRTASAPARAAIVEEAGRDSAAWAVRSPITNVGVKHGEFLVLHGERDAAQAASARDWIDRVRTSGARVESSFLADAGDMLPPAIVQRVAYAFLRRVLAR